LGDDQLNMHFLKEMISRMILVLVCISYSNSLPVGLDDTYMLPYDDSIYVDYNDTLEPDPECSVVPVCQQLASQWGDESLEDDVAPSKSAGCQTYVNCYEFNEFPPEIPTQVTIFTLEGSYFENLTFSNMQDLTSLVEVVMEFNELRYISPGAFQNQVNLEVKILLFDKKYIVFIYLI